MSSDHGRSGEGSGETFPEVKHFQKELIIDASVFMHCEGKNKVTAGMLDCEYRVIEIKGLRYLCFLREKQKSLLV